MTADGLLAAIRSHGVISNDIRDASHEAHHALTCGLRKPWTRDNVHAAVLRVARRAPMALVDAELTARAVEATVCKRLGVEYDVAKWANTMWWETAKNMHISLPVDFAEQAISSRIGTRAIEAHADAVFAIAIKAKRVRRSAVAVQP